MNTEHRPELGTPPAGLLEGKRTAKGKRYGTHSAFSFALDNPEQWVKAFLYDYEPNLESQKKSYAASRSRIKLLRECAESFGKLIEAVVEHDTANYAYIVWLRVVGDYEHESESESDTTPPTD